MGLYTNNLSGFTGTSFESLEEDTSLNTYEGMSLMEAAMNSIAITEENWNAIQREIALTELAYAEETGEEFVYTEATGSGFIAKAKEFFKNIWEKIKSLFRKFLVILGSYTKDDKEFVKKYSKEIVAGMKNIPSDATIKGYKYTLEKFAPMINSKAGDIQTTAMKAIGSTHYADLGTIDYDYAEVMEKVRGTIIGGSALTASEFSEEVFKLVRGNEDSKDDIDLNSGLVNDAMNQLQGMKTIRKVAKEAYTSFEKAFKKVDKDLDTTNKKFSGDLPNADNDEARTLGNAMTGINRVLTVSKGMAGAMQTANGIFLTACKEASRQYKAICVKCVTYRNIKESYDDSFSEGAGTNMFDSVVLR